MDDDTLPVIDITGEEMVDDSRLLNSDQAPPPPTLRPPPRRERMHTIARRLSLIGAMAAIATAGTAGGLAWSSADRSVPAYVATRAGHFADWLHCDGGDPHVRNDLGLWDDAVSSASGGRQHPTPPWLRDRSLSTTKIRTAVDAARWSNANSEAALAFGAVTLQEWDAATRLQVERAEDWVRGWWSRHRTDAPLTWTEGTLLAAARDAVLDDRRLTEVAARTGRGSLDWRVLPLPPGRAAADTAVIGATVRNQGGDRRLVEVLVYRRTADGYLRVRGRAYCSGADDVPSGYGDRGSAPTSGTPPALACTHRLPPEPQSVHETHFDGPVVVNVPLPAIEPPAHLPPGSPVAPDGHTLPHLLSQYEATGPALSPEVALERLKAAEHRPRETVGGNLAYELVMTGSMRTYAVGTYKGQVKLVIELQRQLGGGWEAVDQSGCSADLADPA